MGLFDYLQKPGSKSIKQQPLKIRKELVRTETSQLRASLAPSGQPLNNKPLIPSGISKKRDQLGQIVSLSQSTGSSKQLRTPDQEQKFSSDDSDTHNTNNAPSKRTKSSVSREPDLKRHVRLEMAFSETRTDSFPIVHAADITSVTASTKFVPAWEGLPQRAEVMLQYPSYSKAER